VLDQTGKTVRAFRIPHSAPGFNDLVARLRRLGTPAELPVAIERPDGRLVDRLLEAGHPVVPVRSNAIKAWREGEVVSGAKSDAGEAKVIAEYLRLRHHQLRTLTPFSDATRALRAVVRARDELARQRVAAINQLTACGCRKPRSSHAAWAYSWISPPSRSSRTTRSLAAGSGSGTAPSGGA
jgi:transposase